MTNSFISRERLCLAALSVGLIAGAQHDPGRNAVRQLVRGDYKQGETTIERAPKRSNSPVDQAEKHLVRMLSASLQQDGKKALAEARLAVANGADFGRIAAGPAKDLQALYQAAGYADWAAEHERPLIHGPMIGAVTANSAKIWVRTAQPATITVQLADPAGKQQAFTAESVAGRDLTVAIECTGLQAQTRYAVTVVIADEQVATGSFRTVTPTGTPLKLSVVFGGGAGYTPQYERVWKTIAGHQPDALFMLGDNVYIDDPTHALTNHYCYYRRQSQPDWRALVASTAVYAIYDDHDFGTNDCVPGPFIDKPEWKRPVWEIFRNNWVNPSYGGGDAQPGCWFDTYFGDVHVIFLDCRYYRNLAGNTMLGPVQKAWLKETLKNSRGTFKVIASSVPWSAGVKPGSRDTWDGFPGEREEIFSFLESNKLDGVVLISADRHRIDVRKTPRPNGYPLYDLMSSRLSNVHTHGLVQNAKGSEWVAGYNATPGFARLDFDTTATPPTLTCRIYDLDNKLHETVTIRRDQLAHR